MPSSTSSSNRRLPGAGQWRTWILVPVFLAICLTGSELFFRHIGFLPSLVDSQMLWSIHRDRVYTRDGKKALVILGASRALTDLDPDVIAHEFPEYHVVNLSLDGTSPVAILRDFCLDPAFDGVILCSAITELLLPDDDDLNRRDLQHVDYYRNQFQTLTTRDLQFNTMIEARLQSWAAIMSSELSLRNLVRQGKELKPHFQHLQLNRHRPAYYRTRMTKTEFQQHRERRIARQRRRFRRASPDEFTRVCTEEYRSLYQKLQERGGQMVLVRMPTTGEHWDLDEASAPRQNFWDRIQDLTGIPTVHFQDYPGLSAYECPDTSHLDADDGSEYTHRLAVIMRDILR